MPILLSGSLAYDYIMAFPDTFKQHILPDQIHMLNVCFVVEELKKNYGGTAGNIAYTMQLLGESPVLFSPIGSDGKEYVQYLRDKGVHTHYVQEVKDKLTASAHITTDKEDNQITAFYNGALAAAADMSIAQITEPIDLALISPTDKQGMLAHAKYCAEHNIPFCFDPGQQITAFTPQELMRIIGQAKFLIGNDYEMKLLEEKTGWNNQELMNHVPIVIMTLGEKGSIIITQDQTFNIAPCPPLSVDDPTGAGDAYRAGFFAAYSQKHDYQTCGQVGAVAASYAIEHYGTQNHTFTAAAFASRYEKTYDTPIQLRM
ncbi:MAG: carbohydrate kinase family protein [Candidatus Magasanikbacteria bacterium CG10_big_fil_rev_8_21_14_0_10_43_6]|uniref:Carbohydrate kinase family protein n=1 Tax=Candidatus Magasanikbacteria bacterium CG10_big_fil_rev_8_21_14_0_10_43_6 TaxID=1974650 RepID=A0A2M6W0X2_9BACT|nr:MAG: carbohydrate kinase family protein [Candidatus Magasanikbacteria bacterium CG10_big_fil_rev_8_21_14_0_10_43_6]